MKFSDFIFYISQDEPLPFNCSLYYLTQGNLSYKVNGTETFEAANRSFLSAYYVTNCSIDLIYNYITSLDYDNFNANMIEGLYSNKRDDGDSYVALLFVSSGSCVTAWMLALLLYLSPKHKQKPIVVYLATIFYSISTTIFLHALTSDSSKEYYDNSLDILRIRNSIGDDIPYTIFSIIAQILLDLSWLQLIVHMTKQRFKLLSAIIFGVLVIIYIPWYILYMIDFQISDRDDMVLLSSRWKLISYSFRIVICIYFSAFLLYYTLRIKNPRKLSFVESLIPIGVFSLIVLLLQIVVIALELHIYKSQWLTNIWLSIFPQVFQAITLTTIWEWIYDMEHLEKKLELQGVLGRRLSRDDILQSDTNVSRKKRIRLIDALLVAGTNKSEAKSAPEQICMQDLSNSDKNSNEDSYSQREMQIEDSSAVPSGASTQTAPIRTQSSEESCEIQYIDDYEFSDDDSDDDLGEGFSHNNGNDYTNTITNTHESNSRAHENGNDNPPPFVPHPGFSVDDYDDEKSPISHIDQFPEGSGFFYDK